MGRPLAKAGCHRHRAAGGTGDLRQRVQLHHDRRHPADPGGRVVLPRRLPGNVHTRRVLVRTAVCGGQHRQHQSAVAEADPVFPHPLLRHGFSAGGPVRHCFGDCAGPLACTRRRGQVDQDVERARSMAAGCARPVPVVTQQHQSVYLAAGGAVVPADPDGRGIHVGRLRVSALAGCTAGGELRAWRSPGRGGLSGVPGDAGCAVAGPALACSARVHDPAGCRRGRHRGIAGAVSGDGRIW